MVGAAGREHHHLCRSDGVRPDRAGGRTVRADRVPGLGCDLRIPRHHGALPRPGAGEGRSAGPGDASMSWSGSLAVIRMGERPSRGDRVSIARGRTLIEGRTPGLVARGLWVAIVALSLAEGAMIVATLQAPTADQWGVRGNEALLALAWGSIGALIAVRKPENRIGWLLLALSLINACQGVVDQYPALAAALRLPGGEWARWVSAWIWVIPSTGFLAFVPLIFPDGRLPSPRWRAVVLLGMATMAVLVGTIVLSIRPLGPQPPGANVDPYLQA